MKIIIITKYNETKQITQKKMAEKKNKDRNNAVEQLVELRPFLMEKAALWLRSIQLSDDVVQNVLIQLINKKHYSLVHLQYM